MPAPDKPAAATAEQPPTRVAIACQGGGSHTAFTAGVLGRLFQDDVLAEHRIVGLSGTSGGAICALLAWSSLINGKPTEAGDLLEQFWADNSASSPQDRLTNAFIQVAGKMANYLTMPAMSPYDNNISATVSAQLTELLQRRVDFERDRRIEQEADDPPMLFLGAVDAVSGDFKAFDSRKGEISADAVLASAAIPTLFRSVHTAGGVYWDGLFSQNPPVRELLETSPDEIWVIQINPKARETEPKNVIEIADRRNELAGNLSLYQEIHFIERVDSMLEAGLLESGGKYKPITVRIIEMVRPPSSQALGASSKLNRDPAFLDELISHGRDRANEFLSSIDFEAAWRAGDLDAVVSFFAEDAEIVLEPPFPAGDPQRGTAAARRIIGERLSKGVGLDLTKTQIAADRISWAVRTAPNADGRRVPGMAEARFAAGKIVSFRMGAPAD